jgi:hypothetical protein
MATCCAPPHAPRALQARILHWAFSAASFAVSLWFCTPSPQRSAVRLHLFALCNITAHLPLRTARIAALRKHQQRVAKYGVKSGRFAVVAWVENVARALSRGRQAKKKKKKKKKKKLQRV